MTLKRQLKVYRNARHLDGFDVRVLDAAERRIARGDRVVRLLAVGGVLIISAMVATSAFAQ